MDNDGNEYLALREAKIKRNQERLHKLGLVTSSNNDNSSKSSSSKSSSSNNNNGNSLPNSSTTSRSTSKSSTTVELRRSSRRNKSLSYQEDMNQGQQEMEITNENAKRKKRKRQISNNKNVEQISNITTNTNTTTISTNKDGVVTNKNSKGVQIKHAMDAKPGTTRATFIDVHKILFGQFNHPICVGQQLSTFGKVAVVEHADIQCQISNSSGNGISFNKYSGVCEWKNDALFLWVNINAPNADVKNEFFSPESTNNNIQVEAVSSAAAASAASAAVTCNMQMTWYGGSRMKEESPVIRKLISVGQKAANDQLASSADGIVLWCRMYNTKKKTFDPYICFGRLSYYMHEPSEHPIKFIWNLLDYKVLKKIILLEGCDDNNSDGTNQSIQHIINS